MATGKPSKFLTNYIFNPKEVDLPESYEAEILYLNIWPKGMFMLAQKESLLRQKEFTINGTLFRTKQPRLLMTYADGTVIDVDAQK